MTPILAKELVSSPFDLCQLIFRVNFLKSYQTKIAFLCDFYCLFLVIAKQSLSDRPVGPEGIFGDCKCFRPEEGCPKFWFRQPRNVCPGETRVIEVPETYTDYEIYQEERIIWKEVHNQELVNVPVETYKEVMIRPAIETKTYEKQVRPVSLVPGNNPPPVHVPDVGMSAPVAVHRKVDPPVVGVVKKTEIRKQPIVKTMRKPIKTYVTRKRPVQKVRIHYKKIAIEHINCCPNLKFWFIDLPVVVENNEAYDPNTRDVVRK